MFRLDLKDFLICENKAYLGQRIGDILSAVQDLEQNKGGMGTRQLVANSDRIVGQFRKILHGNWSKKEEKWLKQIQKIAVALAKSIEDKDDLENTLNAVAREIEDLMSKMNVPSNSLATPDSEDENKSTEGDQLADPQDTKEPNQKMQNNQNPQQPENPQVQPTGAEQPPAETAESGAPQNPQPQMAPAF
jgi:5'-3' exonuclease